MIFSFSRIMAGSQLFYTSEIQVSAYLFVNNIIIIIIIKAPHQIQACTLHFLSMFLNFKFYCFVCKYVDPGTVINEQKVTVQGSDSV